MNQPQWGGYLPQLIHFLNAQVISENNYCISINLPVHLHEILLMHMLSMNTFLFVWFEQILKTFDNSLYAESYFLRGIATLGKFEFNQFGFSAFNNVTHGEYLKGLSHEILA